MHKAVSLTNSMTPGSVQAYGGPSGSDNKTYLDGAGVTALVFWVNWNSLQPNPPAPANVYDTYRALSSPGLATKWNELDAQISAANAAGKPVTITFYPGFPPWSQSNYDTSLKDKQEAYGRFPAFRDSNSPWAWFVQYFATRYAKNAPINPAGPHLPGSGEAAQAFFGNPLGAWVTWLQPLNEPNYMWWPQRTPTAPSPDNDVFCAASEMAKSAATVVAAAVSTGSSFGAVPPGLLIPGTSDWASADSQRGTNYLSFTQNFLSLFAGYAWPAGVKIGWAHHNYNDVAIPRSNGTMRVDDVRSALIQSAWPFDGIYLTEGGYHLHTTETPPGSSHFQVDSGESTVQWPAVYNNFTGCKTRASWSPHPIKMWTQYLLHDGYQASWQSSIRGEYNGAPANPPRPLYYHFVELIP